MMLFEDPWPGAVFQGFHVCALCPSAPKGGGKDLFIPGESCVYALPELVLHYISGHNYMLPEEVQEAILQCPAPYSPDFVRKLYQVSDEHFRRILKSGGLNDFGHI